MNNFKTTIGIEVHTVLNTKSKMFSSSKSSHTDEINTNVNEIDLGLLGTMPSVNKHAVNLGIILAQVLNMKINSDLTFDRKNYFYQDLPKGFQITQQYFPIGTKGFIDIEIPNGKHKRITIERIHLEEDTAKQLTINNKTCLDYNRCGMPLIEIVTHPIINNEFEAVSYLNELKRILTFNEISDAKMEEGSLRADINISIALEGCKKLGTKVEVKNINSFTNITKAIKYEVDRQTNLILNNTPIKQETRRWDSETNTTIFMREKSDQVDYHYFSEPNIITIKLGQEYIESVINKHSFSLSNVKKILLEEKVELIMINRLLDDYQLFKAFNYVNQSIKNPNLTITWIVIELVALLKKDNLTVEKIQKEKLNQIIEMIKLVQQQEINSKQAKIIIENIYQTSLTPQDIIKKFGFEQIKDQQLIENILVLSIKNNPEIVNQYSQRPERVEKFLIGDLMRQTKGQANPIISNEILKKLLLNFK